MNQKEKTNKRADQTKAALMRAVEKLAAEKGLSEVSTREILDAAGQKNQSALQYHFGTKDNLFRAVIQMRTTQLDNRRIEMFKEFGSSADLDQLLEILIRPLAEIALDEEGGRDYVGFLSQAMTQPDFDLTKAIQAYDIAGLERALDLLEAEIPELDEAARRYKMSLLFDFTIMTVCRWSREGEDRKPVDDFVAFLVRLGKSVVRA